MEDFNPDDEPKEPQREEEEESDLVGHEKSYIYSHVDVRVISTYFHFHLSHCYYKTLVFKYYPSFLHQKKRQIDDIHGKSWICLFYIRFVIVYVVVC